MKALWREALDAEPLLKYSFLAMRISVVIFFYLVAIMFALMIEFVIGFFDLISTGSESSEEEADRLINCALQEQWERDHR